VVTAANIAAIDCARVSVIACLVDDLTADAHECDATEHAARSDVFVELTIAIIVESVARRVARNAHGRRIGFAAATAIDGTPGITLERKLLSLNGRARTRLIRTTEKTQGN
jgi:hypothetical protein